MSEVSGTVTFNTPSIFVNPEKLGGRFDMTSFGITIGSFDVGATTIYLGNSMSTRIDSFGLDGGVSIGVYGKSKVENYMIFDSSESAKYDPMIYRE